MWVERVNWQTVHGWLTESSLIRRSAEAMLRAAGRRHLARFDRQAPARCQNRILLGLLHQAQNTRFGREHDFRRIRTVADYRRLVPLWTRADLWREYWQPVYPHLAGATWPGPSANGQVNDDSYRPRPSAALQSAHRRALRTALALIAHAQPRTALLSGALLLPGEEGPSSVWEQDTLRERLPSLARPFARLGEEALAERCAHLRVTCLIGTVERLLPLLENVRQFRGKRCLRDVWPNLSAILYTRRSPTAPVAQLRAEAEGVLLLETAGRAEGPIAVEDPRHGLMRLLFDHGVFFEFISPAADCEAVGPRRGIDEIEIGVPYELVMTSPAGLWACRIGRTVCLERRDPLLLRFLEPAKEAPVADAPGLPTRRRPRRTDLILPTLPEVGFHPQSDGNPAAPPGSSFHTPWSILADRG
jgi:hypothetical protein